jgi:hypothetical protein
MDRYDAVCAERHGSTDVLRLLKVIDRRRISLQERAFRIGGELFLETRAQALGRLNAYWKEEDGERSDSQLKGHSRAFGQHAMSDHLLDPMLPQQPHFDDLCQPHVGQQREHQDRPVQMR